MANKAEKGREGDPQVVVVQQPVPVVQQSVPKAEKGREGDPQVVVGQQPVPVVTGNGQGAAVTGNGQGVVTTQPQTEQPQYLYDWSNTSLYDAFKKGDYTPYQIIHDKEKWSHDTKTEYNRGLEYLQLLDDEKDPNKTAKENEEERKREKNKKMWGDIGHLLIGLGNFAGAIGGAPEPGQHVYQHVNKLRESQRLRRDKVNEDRKAYNRQLLEQMFKQKAEERANELKLANIGLIQERVRASQEENRRKDEKSKAEIAALEALEEQRRNSGKASLIRANKTGSKGGGGGRSGGRGVTSKEVWETLQDNITNFPNEAKEFMSTETIHGYNNKDWTLGQAIRFNQSVKGKRKPSTRNTQSTSTTKTPNDYSKYIVK